MKSKNNAKNYILGFIVAVIILIATGFLGSFIGVFEDISGVFDMIKISKEIVIKLIIMFAFMVAANNILQLILGIFSKKSGRTGTLATVFSSLIKYSVVLISFCWGMTIIGVNVSTVFASVGIVALILGFGAESLVADLVTGVFVLFENQFNVGDIIEIDGYRGVVDSVGIRTICIKDSGGNIKIINNSDLKNVVNRSNTGSVTVSEISVSYEVDLDELESKFPRMLAEIKSKHEDIFIGNLAYLGVEELAESAVILKFVAEVDESNYFKGRRILNKELKCAFDRAKIEIPYPQMDVHTK